jgi:TetR/AcrR family transcriptional regulator
VVTASVTKSASSRMSSTDRRRQIVGVAAELFSNKGFNGTTTKEIATRAGVSEAIIFRHFPTKEVLYSAILDVKTRESSTQLREHLKDAARRKDDHAFFGQLAFDLLEFHLKDQCIIRLLMFSALERHKLSEIFFQSTAREFRNQVRRYIKQRIADGAFRAVDSTVCARAFIGMILHHIQVRVLYKDTSADDIRLSSRQIADRLVDLFLHGIRKR